MALTDERRKTVVTGIEMFRKLLDYAEAGDNIGALLRGVSRETRSSAARFLAKPGTIHPAHQVPGPGLCSDQGRGRPSYPLLQQLSSAVLLPNHRRYRRVISLPEGTEMCMPGDNVEMDVELITPIAIEEGLRFAIREGGRTVGSGVVTGINE